MLAFAADENFNNDILRALVRRRPDLDIVRIQDIGLAGAEDPRVLEWAAGEGRVLLTHDATTITRHAYDRASRRLSMPGVFELAYDIPIGIAIEEILLIAECSLDGEWEGQVRYLLLR